MEIIILYFNEVEHSTIVFILAFYGNLFSLETMKEMLEEHDLNYESDVNVCRYVDGEKEILNKEGEISLKEFNDLMDKEKATFQVHQPQRYICLLYTSPSPRDKRQSRMPSSA